MVQACFKQKSTLVKFLIVLLVILICVLVALFIYLVKIKDNHVCSSEQCIKASAEIIKYIDQSVNPCDDFYAFTCGNFMRNIKELPPADPYEELDLLILEDLQIQDRKPFSTQKLFYRACTNLAAINFDQEETILQLFNELGEWPVLRGPSWNGTFFEWTEVARKSRRLGMKFDWFLDFTVYESVSGTGILKIDIPPSLKRMDHNETEIRKHLVTDIAVFMGAPKYLAHYETAKAVQFENDVGAIAEDHRQRRREMNMLAHPKLTIDEIQTLWPSIHWLQLIKDITHNEMYGSNYIIFNILDYVQDLNRLILGTPKRIVADYMLWKIIEESWQFLSQPIREKFEEYNERVHKQEPQRDRQKFCLEESKKRFPIVAESVYIRRHVTEKKRQMVRDMLYSTRSHYIKLLTNASWMNRDIRRKSLSKLQNLQFFIGGPHDVFDEFAFADNLGLYDFGFKTSNVIDMLNEIRDRFYNKYFDAINRNITSNTFMFYEKVINITTFSIINQDIMVIPAALLRDTFYNPDLPNYLNYGTLGKVLAHEIFQFVFRADNETAIDHEDNDYNSWSESDVFDAAVKCLIKESSYLHNADLQRSTKMRENLANFIASDAAYDSYHMWLQMLPRESRMPALNFTLEQLFWIQSSKFSCSRIYSKHHRDNSRFKIIGPVRNSRNFAEDFRCPEGSKMNPRRKCRIL